MRRSTYPSGSNAMINIGFIGCGRISDLHAPGYQNHPDARIYGVCDLDPELAAKRKAQWGAEKVYTDYRAMLDDPAIHAVEILSPQLLHEQMAIDAAQSGKHICLQKPMTIDLDSADRILAHVENASIIFKVTDNYLFYPPIVLARRMIENGDIGTPHNLRIKLITGGSGGWEVPPDAWKWRLAEKAAGRGLEIFDHGHHLWSTAWYLMGKVERVKSWIDSLDGIIDSPATIMWKYAGGIQYGMCEFSHAAEMAIPSKYYANDEWIDITGAKGIIRIPRCTGEIVPGPGISVFRDGHWTHDETVKTDWAEGFIGSTHNFIDAIMGRAAPLLTGAEAREILALTLAIAKSGRTRREVYVDELDAAFPWLYTQKRIWQESRQAGGDKSWLGKLGLGSRDARYADQAEGLTLALPDRFDAAQASDWQVRIGLQLLAEAGMVEMLFGLEIRQGRAELTQGALPEKADLLIRIPAGSWAAILLGKKRIETAFLQGKLKLEGQAEQGLKLRKAFKI